MRQRYLDYNHSTLKMYLFVIEVENLIIKASSHYIELKDVCDIISLKYELNHQNITYL